VDPKSIDLSELHHRSAATLLKIPTHNIQCEMCNKWIWFPSWKTKSKEAGDSTFHRNIGISNPSAAPEKFNMTDPRIVHHFTR
jgi:hypothetical protein